METKELDLDAARREIDAVDAELAALFERRMAAVLAVAEYKRAHGLPIYDAAREAVVLQKAAARIQNPALRPYYADHVQNLMDVAKQLRGPCAGAEPRRLSGRGGGLRAHRAQGAVPARRGHQLPHHGQDGVRGRGARRRGARRGSL